MKKIIIALITFISTAAFADTYCPSSFDAHCTGDPRVSYCTLSNVVGSNLIPNILSGASYHGMPAGDYLNMTFTSAMNAPPNEVFNGVISCYYRNANDQYIMLQIYFPRPVYTGNNWQQVDNVEQCYQTDARQCAFTDN